MERMKTSYESHSSQMQMKRKRGRKSWNSLQEHQKRMAEIHWTRGPVRETSLVPILTNVSVDTNGEGNLILGGYF